ncbi:Hypothetical protein, putative COF family HAD hydrolase [Metamycoplasma alkalescens 14918]|uniref:Uncharacterized protein n=2 Tax=Metamycoplasma alkalescens TaxID=45363 RepID=N9TZY2_9BACT|nr:Cof-type HAD-IIB family hydrolase [Metamycoplasma alkalescens]ENY53842.1 Hypothetical protein, putative COF family HAD hydrolase [Metamycoplasma alkalescens 14918]
MINFKPKAYFTDLDGTLLDLPKTKEKISQKNLNILKEKNDNGIPFIIATGRYASDFVLDLAKKTNSPYVICQNGGLVVDTNGEVLIKHEIEKDTVIKIVDALKEKKLFFIFNSGNTIYGSSAKLKLFRPWIKKMVQKNYDEMPKITKLTKIITFGTSKKNIKKLAQELQDQFKNISLYIVSKGYAIEINDINASKGRGIEFVSKLSNIDPKEAIHFGDSGNDTSSIPYVGAFVAMKNSLKNIKSQATWIAGSYKKSGVYEAVRKIENLKQ